MLWSIWHYPLFTAIAMLVVLAAFRVSAALTRAVDIEAATEGEAGGREALDH
jgi:hypothetical protein